MGCLSTRILSLKIKVVIAEKRRVPGRFIYEVSALFSVAEQVPKIFPPISESPCIFLLAFSF
jgi:hypothetical protein